VRLTSENISLIFQNADCIVEAFDSAEDKRMFLEAFGGTGKLLVMGNGMSGIRNASPLLIRKLSGPIYLVGDGETAATPETPPCAPRVMACAALMASVVLECICEK